MNLSFRNVQKLENFCVLPRLISRDYSVLLISGNMPKKNQKKSALTKDGDSNKMGLLSKDNDSKKSGLTKQNKHTNIERKDDLDEISAKMNAIELDKNGDVLINIHCKPGSSANMIKGELQFPDKPRLDVKIHSRAVEGQANSELQEYLADVLDVRKNDFSFVHGMKSREKTLRLSKDVISLEKVKEKINNEIDLTKDDTKKDK